MTVFGGYDESNVRKNDVYILDLATGTWSSAITTSGTPPSAREKHSSVGWIDPTINSPKLTVFGGDDGSKKNELYPT
jgi:hypothetical protein